MPDYSIEQLVMAAYHAGFRGNALLHAAAVSLAENQSRSLSAHNTGTPGNIEDSYGPWQINRLAHPQYTAAELTTLEGNAKAAYEVYQSAGATFQPWTQFTNGAYLSFLSVVQPMAGLLDSISGGLGNSLPGLPSLPDLPSIPNPLDGIINVIKAPIELLMTILNWMVQERHWWQLAFILAGLSMTGAGLAIFFKSDIEKAATVAGMAAV